MQLNTCFVILLVGLALTRAIPTDNEKKSLDEKNANIDDAAGEDKERDKKSILCLNMKDNTRTLNLVPQSQTLSIQPVANPAQTIQTLSIQPAVQPVQTLNIQPAVQPVQTFSIQQAPQPAQTLCIQPAVNFIQTQPAVPCQTNDVEAQIESVPKPSEPYKEEYAKPTGQPVKMIKMEREELMDIVPIYQESGCNEQLVAPMPRPVLMVPQPEVVAAYVRPYKAPCCQQCQQSVMRCKCRPRGITALRHADMMMDQPMHYMGFRNRGMMDDHAMDAMRARMY